MTPDQQSEHINGPETPLPDMICDHHGKGMYWCRHCEPSTRELQEMLAGAYKFKDWVHDWLDAHGVPADPDPKHTAETGCRISGRMEWLMRNIHLDLLQKLKTAEEQRNLRHDAWLEANRNLAERTEQALTWKRRCEAAEAALIAERTEWCAMFGVKHPPGKPLSPKDARLLREIFKSVE